MPKTAQERVCSVLVARTPDHPAVVHLAVGKDSDLFFVADLPCDVKDHRAFELIRYRHADRGYESAVGRYHALVAAPSPDGVPRGSCDCPGGTYHKGVCRHVAFLSVLWRRGAI